MNDLTFHGPSNPLVETFEFVPKVLTEEAVATGGVLAEDAKPIRRTVLEGVFQRADTQNANKRVYPRGLWEKLCKPDSRMMAKIRERAMIGHVEHPKDGVTDLSKGAILITEVKLQEDGTVWGKCLVYNTPAGRLVQEYIDTGTKIGISSRGTGSVDSKGVVQEDYNCDTWDIVYNPSTPGAHPKPTRESEETAVNEPKQTTEKSVDESAAADAALTKALAEGANSVEQKLLQAGGPAWVAGKTGLKDNDLAMVYGRFISFVIQRGAMFSELDPMWTEFLKFYPQVGKGAGSAGETDAKPGAAVLPAPGNEIPPIKKVESAEGDSKPDDKPADDKTKGAEKAPQLDEQGLALLAEAKARVTALEAQVAEATTKFNDVSVKLESSTATNASLNEANVRLQSMVDAYKATLGALTAVNVAAQVREAVEVAIKGDSRLAAFRDVLEKEESPASVGTRAKKLVDTIQEAAGKSATNTKEKTLVERIRVRSATNEDSALPGKAGAASEVDADKVEESATPKSSNPMVAAAARAVAGLKASGFHN